MKITTFNKVRPHMPCISGWEAMLAATGKNAPDDQPVTFEKIAQALDVRQAIWCCRGAPEYSTAWRSLAADIVRNVGIVSATLYAALDVADKHAAGLATDADLAAVHAACSGAEPDQTGALSATVAQYHLWLGYELTKPDAAVALFDTVSRVCRYYAIVAANIAEARLLNTMAPQMPTEIEISGARGAAMQTASDAALTWIADKFMAVVRTP